MTYKEALEKIATVNAMDYEYQAWAREALAKQEQGEPVAIVVGDAWNSAIHFLPEGLDLPIDTLLYTTPPQRKPLTDEQIVPMFSERQKQQTEGEKDAWYFYAWGVNDGEAAHGIKGQP